MIEMYIRSPQFVTELLKRSLFPDIEHMPDTHVYTHTVTGTRSQNLRKERLVLILAELKQYKVPGSTGLGGSGV